MRTSGQVGRRQDAYFATLSGNDYTHELLARVDDWQNFMRSSGVYTRMLKSHRAYYGLSRLGTTASSEIRPAGERGELSLLTVNHHRNLIQHLLSLVFNQRPALQCRATNTDVKSQQQCILGDSVIDYYMREKRLERQIKRAVEMALVYSEGYIAMRWDVNKGDVHAINPETGEPIHEGDVDVYVMSPLDVIRDPYSRNYEDTEWIICTRYVNRWNLVKKFPEKKDEILGLEDDRMRAYRSSFLSKALLDSELIPVYEFYHKKTDQVPEGRYSLFVDVETVLLDTALPYKRVPVFRVTPGDMFETPFGFTPAFDILGLQQAYDTLHSTIVTNQSAFGVQNVIVPQGHNLSPVEIPGGMNLFTYNPAAGKPEPLNLLSTPAEIFSYVPMISAEMERIMGINSVVRGNPSESLKSGSALALVASQAIQFASGFQQSIVELMEDCGTALVEILQEFAKTKRIAAIVGKNNEYMLKSFSGDDLSNISRVTVEVQNPIMRTKEGRMEVANQLLGAGLVKRAEQYISVMQTGKLDPILEAEQDELLNIRQENEALARGEIPIAVFTDNHQQHIMNHKSVLNGSGRRDPDIVQAVSDHIAQHIELLRGTDPDTLMMLGQQPLQPLQPPVPQAAVEDLGAIPEMESTIPPDMQNPPNMPNMPVNPLTGQRFNDQTGGL